MVSEKSEKIINNKFIKEFEKILYDLSINKTIDYYKLGEILKRLNFLNNEIDIDNPLVAI